MDRAPIPPEVPVRRRGAGRLARNRHSTIRFEERVGHVDPTRPFAFMWEVLGPDESVGFRYVGMCTAGAAALRSRDVRRIERALRRRRPGCGYASVLAEAVRQRWALRLTFIANGGEDERPEGALGRWRRFLNAHGGPTRPAPGRGVPVPADRDRQPPAP